MELTDKDIRKLHKMAVAAYNKMKATQDFLAAYENGRFNITSYPRMYFTTNNIFKVQDAIGGELRQDPFYFHNDTFDVILELDGVMYIQSGLTQEDINARQSNLDYTF